MLGLFKGFNSFLPKGMRLDLALYIFFVNVFNILGEKKKRVYNHHVKILHSSPFSFLILFTRCHFLRSLIHHFSAGSDFPYATDFILKMNLAALMLYVPLQVLGRGVLTHSSSPSYCLLVALLLLTNCALLFWGFLFLFLLFPYPYFMFTFSSGIALQQVAHTRTWKQIIMFLVLNNFS